MERIRTVNVEKQVENLLVSFKDSSPTGHSSLPVLFCAVADQWW